jgi:hypothetical protein
MQPTASYDLFISYATADSEWVHGYLLPALGLPTGRTITSHDFQPGAALVAEFERAIKTSRYTLLVLSPAFLADQWAAFGEMLSAHSSVAGGVERLIPLERHPCALPLRIDFRVRLDCTDEESWPDEVDRLRQVLSVPEQPAVAIPCPYPGIAPFQASNASFFYGREAEIRTILQQLAHQRYMFMIGPSGSGKSSLLYAGLLPRLKQAGVFPPGHWLISAQRPGDQRMQTLVHRIGDDPGHAGQLINGLIAARPPAKRLLLVIDQFEELFTQADRSIQNYFIAALQVLRTVETCTLLIAMRADFYPDLMHSDLWPIDISQRIELAPLRGPALRSAIVQPATDMRVYLDPALLERLLADAASEPGILPLVQETMRLLWDDRQQRLLTLSAYERLGSDGRSGLATAVATLANATLADLSPAQQQIARRIFLCLVQLGESGPDTRRQQPLPELESPYDDPQDFQHTLDHLTCNGLITRSGQAGAAPRVDLAHEVLITGWPRLRAWLDEDRAGLLLHRRFAQTVDEWVAEQRDPSFLYGGARLAEVQTYAAQHTGDVSQDESEFLSASAAREAIRLRARYLGQATGGALGAAFGYAMAFAIAKWSENQDANQVLLTFLFMVPNGQVVGLAIGMALWLFRENPKLRVIYAGLFAAIASAVAYVAFLWLFMGTLDDMLKSVVTGIVLGAGLGVGIGLRKSGASYVLNALIGGLLAALLVVLLNSVSWSLPIALVAGIVLGACTGLGFQLTAAERDEYAPL